MSVKNTTIIDGLLLEIIRDVPNMNDAQQINTINVLKKFITHNDKLRSEHINRPVYITHAPDPSIISRSSYNKPNKHTSDALQRNTTIINNNITISSHLNDGVNPQLVVSNVPDKIVEHDIESPEDNTTEIKSLLTFKQYLRNNLPDWYIAGNYVDITLIENAYNVYFNDNNTPAVISRQLNGLIFNDSKRSNGITYKKLMPL